MAGNPMAPSQRLFMGATPYSDAAGAGVTFRVWAPFAQQVAVIGQFNNWSPNATMLSSEGNGYWSVDVPGATVGQQYKFVVFNPAKVQDRASFSEPHQYATGFAAVLVNGVVVVKDDQHTGARPAKALRHGPAAANQDR